jgi:hypothetical protein
VARGSRLVAAAIVAPAAARAQTSAEAALPNRLAPTIYIPSTLALGSGSGIPARAGAVDGARALLARTPAVPGRDPEIAHDDEASGSPSGAQALLGRSDALDPRRRMVLDASK